ncbi:MAG: molybdenum cofactor guanylyltransferase [Actinomycetota bacterium]
MDGVVLAGGLSTRMGRDKAGLEIAGEALYVRAARRLSAAGCSRVVVTVGPTSRHTPSSTVSGAIATEVKAHSTDC